MAERKNTIGRLSHTNDSDGVASDIYMKISLPHLRFGFFRAVSCNKTTSYVRQVGEMHVDTKNN